MCVCVCEREREEEGGSGCMREKGSEEENKLIKTCARLRETVRKDDEPGETAKAV